MAPSAGVRFAVSRETSWREQVSSQLRSGAETQRLGLTLAVTCPDTSPRFPNRVNVGFMEIVDRTHIRLRVFERGVGETLACGSGACAAAAILRRRDLLDERVAVTLPGGTLAIEWACEGEPLWMSGPATFVFEGTLSE